MKRNNSVIMIAICFLILVSMGLGLVFYPQREYSVNENRWLQKMPDVSIQSLMDGSFTSKFERMCSDQVLFRDYWIAARSRLLRWAGNQDIGGVYLGEDGFLFERHTKADVLTTRYEKNLSYVNSLASKTGVPCTVMLVPGASDVLADFLPENHQQYDTEKAFSAAQAALTECRFLDLRSELGALGAEAYYRTDHHWTMEGAMQGYRAWCDAAGLEVREHTLTTVAEDFRGTLYSKVLLSECAYDAIALPAEPEGITCMADGDQIPVYHFEKLEEKDKYTVLFGGNYGRLDISGGNGASLLIIKDSYANAFAPFIAEDYSSITMIDLRYFSGSVSALAEKYDEVLFLYEISNFAQDSNLLKLLF
jgi:hypothetical protein